jgi:hypothetical protein
MSLSSFEKHAGSRARTPWKTIKLASTQKSIQQYRQTTPTKKSLELTPAPNVSNTKPKRTRKVIFPIPIVSNIKPTVVADSFDDEVWESFEAIMAEDAASTPKKPKQSPSKSRPKKTKAPQLLNIKYRFIFPCFYSSKRNYRLKRFINKHSVPADRFDNFIGTKPYCVFNLH